MTMFSKRTKVYSLEFILDKVAAFIGLTADIIDALNGAASPSAGNPFATMADVGGGGDMTKAVYDTNDDGIVNASANSALLQGNNGAYHLDRTNHTGTQLAATISDFSTAAAAVAATVSSTQITALGLGTASTLASDTDGTLAANSDTKVATQKATKTYVDTIAARNNPLMSQVFS